MPASEPFELAKWYLDGMAPDGRLFVAYWTRLRWRGVSWSWHSHATTDHHGRLVERSSLARVAPPAWQGSSLVWRSAPLACAFEYQPLVPPFARSLLDSSSGSVEWQCEVPHGRVAAVLGPNSPIHGLGYAEHIRFTLPPWRLPIRELRWGRWIADDGSHHLVWIEWRGESPRTWVILDGCDLEAATVSDRAVEASGTRLSLDEPRPLRSRALGEVIGRIPGLGALVPRSLMAWQETRWAGRGPLRMRDGPAIPGSMLFEHVVLG